METNTKLKTVKDLRELTGVTRKQLHKFHTEGLLEPTRLQNEAGYKLYDDNAIEKLWQILIFIEIGTPLKEIKKILNGNTYDRNTVIQQQIDALNERKKRIEEMISIAEIMQLTGTEESALNKILFSKRGKLTQQLSEWTEHEEYKNYSDELDKTMDEFFARLEPLIIYLAESKTDGIESGKLTNALVDIERLAREYKYGRLLLWTITMSLLGKGEIYISWLEEFDEETLQFISEWLAQLIVISFKSTIDAYTEKFDWTIYGDKSEECKKDYITGLKKAFTEIFPFFTDIEFYDACKQIFQNFYENEQGEFALAALETYYSGGE